MQHYLLIQSNFLLLTMSSIVLEWLPQGYNIATMFFTVTSTIILRKCLFMSCVPLSLMMHAVVNLANIGARIILFIFWLWFFRHLWPMAGKLTFDLLKSFFHLLDLNWLILQLQLTSIVNIKIGWHLSVLDVMDCVGTICLPPTHKHPMISNSCTI